ncbi:MAG: OmpA family protein, partial [Acidobacteria bacterium]|nr:OmpA family protein [Acidobacteriota bacterium]
FPDFVVTVAGHCDEGGSAEYNLALADLRAQRAREFLQQLGVPAARLRAISYGKDRPHCTEPVEACWQENRRAHLSTAR